MNNIEYVYNVMRDVTDKTPVLLVGNAAFIFKRLYKGYINRIENTEDAKEFISKYYGIEYNKPIVVEDISLLYKDSILLKLVEEIKLPLILLASSDNISVPLQSRIKTYIKFPNDTNFGCNFISILDAQQYIQENEITGKDLDKYIAENCPQLAIINKQMETRKNKDKLIQLLGGLEKNEKNN